MRNFIIYPLACIDAGAGTVDIDRAVKIALNGNPGGHHIPDLYKDHSDLWYDVTYHNLVKISFYAYRKYHGLACEDVKCNLLKK